MVVADAAGSSTTVGEQQGGTVMTLTLEQSGFAAAVAQAGASNTA